MAKVKSYCAVVTKVGLDVALDELDKKINELKPEDILSIQDTVHMLGQTPLLTRVVIYKE
ncbi:MAG: hypothetical protein V1845_01385 [bacterium]